MSRGDSLISWGEGSSLALVGNPSRDGVSIKMLVWRHLKPKPQDFEILGWCPAGTGEGASLALVGHHSSDGVTIKMPYGVDVLHQLALHPIFSYWVG